MDIGVSVYQAIRTLPIPADIYSPLPLKQTLTIIYVLIRSYACVLHIKLCSFAQKNVHFNIFKMRNRNDINGLISDTPVAFINGVRGQISGIRSQMKPEIKSSQDMEVRQKAMDFVVMCYQMTTKFSICLLPMVLLLN